MTAFSTIRAAAERRVGGPDTLVVRLPRPEPPEGLAMVGDDRYLSLMSRRIFRAGLKHNMVDARWPAFEAAFNDFEPAKVASLDDRDIADLMRDERLIRHRGKLTAVRDNARAMRKLTAEAGTTFGVWLADWPEDDIVGLWEMLAARFSQLGGNSGPAFLRMAGKDTFLLTSWVSKALNHWDVHAGTPKGKRARRTVQTQFVAWMDESDWPLCAISQTLALSVD